MLTQVESGVHVQELDLTHDVGNYIIDHDRYDDSGGFDARKPL